MYTRFNHSFCSQDSVDKTLADWLILLKQPQLCAGSSLMCKNYKALVPRMAKPGQWVHGETIDDKHWTSEPLFYHIRRSGYPWLW